MTPPEIPPPPLVLLAHGSRHPGVQASIESLATATATRTGGEVVGAFLDLSAPDLTTAATRVAAVGHRRAVVVPLLFTPAFHARVDTPAAVAKAAAVSGIDLITAAVLGTGDDIGTVLEEATAEHDVAGDRPILVHGVGSSRPEANADVAALAARWQQRRGARVSAGFATAEPRTATLLATAGPGTVVVPLFVSPGLLLDRIADAAATHDVTVLPPLGDRLAPVVVERFRAALADR